MQSQFWKIVALNPILVFGKFMLFIIYQAGVSEKMGIS